MNEVSAVLDDVRIAAYFGRRLPARGCTFSITPPVKCASMPGSHGRPVASLNEGRIVIAPLPSGAVVGARDGFTVCLSAAALSGDWEGDLLVAYGRGGKAQYSLRATNGCLALELFTDHRPEPLHLEAPSGVLAHEVWHCVIVRYNGHRIELHIDGDLVDEEWPAGAVVGEGAQRLIVGANDSDEQSRSGFSGFVDHLFLWDRALSNPELENLIAVAGSHRATEKSETRMHQMQYATAPGGGYVGDCFPFFHEGVYHLYYLFDRRNHRSKYGLGAHQWAHSSSNNLIDWEYHPIALPITEKREGSICTGSVFFHDGLWYAFYATRMLDRSEHLSLATSRDGIHFEKADPNPFSSPEPPYRRGPFRDPTVFRDSVDGRFHMIVTAELAEPPIERRGGCLAHLISDDLRTWKQLEPFLVTGYTDQPECSELFEWNQWYYLVFSHFGSAHYRVSRSPFGPWKKPLIDTFDGPQARVMKSAPFIGGRRIGVGFLAIGNGYAGRAVFREYLQLSDGSIATRWPPEMIPATGPPINCHAETVRVEAGIGIADKRGVGRNERQNTVPLANEVASHTGAHIEAASGFAALGLDAVPLDFLLHVRITAKPGTEAYGIAIRGSERMIGALHLEFDPFRRKVGWRRAENPSWQENETAAIFNVAGLEATLDVALAAYGDVLDVCVNERRTLISRNETAAGDRLFLYCHKGEVTFSRLEIRPITLR